MRVIVVGAGVTGLSLGAMLRRLNIDCVVVERAAHLQSVYQPPAVLWCNALTCMRAFGIDQCLDHVLPEHSFGIRQGRTKRWLCQVKNDTVKMPELTYYDQIPSSNAPTATSFSYVSQLRQEFEKLNLAEVPMRMTLSAEVLKNSLRMHCQDVRFGQTVVGLEPSKNMAGGVNVIFDDGRAEWADVLVGADGLHSTVRHLVYPDQQEALRFASHQMMQIDGCLRVEEFPDKLGSASCCDFWGAQKALSYMPMEDSVDGKVAHFSAVLVTAPKELTESQGTSEGFRHAMVREFQDFGDEITTMLRSLEITRVHELLKVPVMPQWHNYRAVLAGDAAHGTYPSPLDQDLSLCIEDAAVLATALMEVPMPTDTGFAYAFKRYEQVRRQRIDRYRLQADRARQFFQLSPAVRDTICRVVPAPVWIRHQRWLTDWSYSGKCLLNNQFESEGMVAGARLYGNYF